MSQDKIDIKDVTPKTYNPKTHQVIASMYAKAKGLTRNCVVTVVGSYCFSSL